MIADLLYQEVILDHFRNPRNKGVLAAPTFAAKDANPSCGDVIRMQVSLDDGGRIAQVMFDGKGCAISQAAASMLTDMLQGKSLDEARALRKEDLLTMLGIPISGIRLKCALLPLKALKLGLYAHLGKSLDAAAEGLDG